MTRLLIVLAVTTLLAGLLWFGLTTSQGRAVGPTQLGRVMPDFSRPVFARYQAEFGETLSLPTGKPVVVSFWASWCGPCHAQAPTLEVAWRRYRSQVKFIGVNTQDRGNERQAEAFLDQSGITFPNVKDLDNRLGVDFGLFGVPETFFIRRDGTLQHRHVGQITAAQLSAQLEELLQ
jgi:cytochrome c biogenesis protein CcmG/thiol:disulfide interchange protein DsbE